MSQSAPNSFDRTERWCRDAGFVRALAGRLIQDPFGADDLAQSAWLRALRGHGPRAGFRAWMAAIVRNTAISHHRRTAARTRHEGQAPPRDADDDPATVAARLEAHELLIAAVRALDEPYRNAIVLRYFEGLSPRAIAARRGLPVRTVHTHLQRALSQLRTALHTRDARWPALLLPILPSSITTLVMTSSTTKSALLGGFLLVLFASTSWQLLDRDPAPAALGNPAPGGVAAADVGAVPTAPGADSPRDAVAGATAVDPAPAAAEPWQVFGTVVDLGGAPLAGVPVTLTAHFAAEPMARATSDPTGRFAFTLPAPSGGEVDVDDPQWTTIYGPVLWGNRDVGELTVVADRAQPVAGVVVDEAGAPVAGAEVSLTGTAPPRSRFASSLERAKAREWATKSLADGTFTVPRAPQLPDLQIHARASGYRHAHAVVDVRRHLRVVLQRAPMLHGRVFDAQGRPLAAAVFCHPAGTMSADDGWFELDLSHVSSPWIVAAVAGQLPARRRCDGDAPNEPSSWPQPFELHLGGTPLAISGRAVASDGTPLPQPRVTLLDAECLVPGNDMSSIEFLARVHSRVTADGAEFWESGGLTPSDPGAFAIGGLQDRSYRLRLESVDTCQSLETGPIRAGAHDVELRLPQEPMWSALAGVVVDRRGNPVPRANVWLERADPAANTVRSTPAVTTGIDGRFARGPVACAAHMLCVQTEGIAHPTRYDLSGRRDHADLRIEAPVVARVRIVTAVAADTAAFLCADDTSIAATVTHGDTAWGAFDVPLSDGASEVIAVPDVAAFLILRKDGREVARIRVELQPGEVQTLRP